MQRNSLTIVYMPHIYVSMKIIKLFSLNIRIYFYRTFVAEMSFYVKQLGRTIHGRDTGSNKQTASKSCALSLVRQLFHLGVIEAFTGM